MNKMTEIYRLAQGLIAITHYDRNLSVGVLELEPKQELSRHNRPVDEELVQIYGSSTMKIFEGDNLIKDIVLKKGERVVIPANQYHIHSNPTGEKSITLWKFEGDIVEVIENIRKGCKKVL